MYTVLTTYPSKGCRNVGDQLIEEAIKTLLTRLKGETEFFTIFREDDLSNHLDRINQSKAVIFPLAIRDLPLWPGCYRFTGNLSDFKVPLIPIGTNYNVYPGDCRTRKNTKYSEATRQFLHYLADQNEYFSCREYHTCRLLKDHGISNTLMTGDPAWYEVNKIGQPMQRKGKVDKLVFSPPLSHFYLEQAIDIMRMLGDLLPEAEKFCVFHTADMNTFKEATPENSYAMSPQVTEKNTAIAEFAEKNGFEVKYLFGESDKLQFYLDCDLHIGYECHAHLYFLRHRIPSVMITEDARGFGFSYSLGGASFDGFERCMGNCEMNVTKNNTSGYCTTLKEYSIAPSSYELLDQLRQYLEEELENNFRRISSIAGIIDDTYYSAMEPFIKALP
jgi:hypothetical protein